MAVETVQIAFNPQTERQMVAGRVPRRFTADEFERMGKLGILDEDERIELIDGEIIEMAGVNIDHVNCVVRLTRLLSRILPDEFVLHVQNPVRLSDTYQPQPDLYIVPDREYTAIPTPDDVLLLIEVSDSSLAYDRGEKMRMYAAGIAEYWVADVSGKTVERFAELRNGVYKRHDIAQQGNTVASLAVPEIAVAVAGIWK